jgi:uncharacterized protein (DUF488 family)
VRFYTVGHSTRSAEELFELLRAHDVSILADVRTIPRSRRHPQFEKTALEKSLPEQGIRYVHMKALGGLRKPRADSINVGWRNESFRGYADWMQTADFEHALRTLVELASNETVCVMCAEAVPWRCHRSLLSDALVARGIEVRHIMTTTKADAHAVTKFARIEGERVTYPAEAPDVSRPPPAQLELPRFGEPAAAPASASRRDRSRRR